MLIKTFNSLAQSTGGTAEYTDSISCREVRPPTNKFLGYDTKQSESEDLVMLELWKKWSTSSLPLPPSPLWPGVVALDRVLSMGQIELKCVPMLN